ncbi:MAG: HIRAN domain-containing protein [Gammaproteobacteria bacterium]
MRVGSLFVAWQHPSTREWAPVARLTRDHEGYRFVYTKGADRESFVPFGRLTDLRREYVSEELFPLFANRLLARSRPEYEAYLRWLGLSRANYDVLDELARTGRLRATDQLELIPCPKPSQAQRYEVFFFARGLRHFTDSGRQRCMALNAEEPLFLARDVQNAQDPDALLLRTGDPVSVVGYTPRYYSAEFTRLMRMVSPGQVEVRVKQINVDAPIQYRLLCHLSAPWPSGFSPCTQDAYQPMPHH